MSRAVSELTEYAVRKGWIEKEDRVYISNLILDAIGEQSFEGLEEIDGDLRDIHLILRISAISHTITALSTAIQLLITIFLTQS